MARPGPAPKPKRLKLLRGTYQPCRDAPSAPSPDPVVPSCPRWLGREAKAEWRRVTKELGKLKLLTRLDRGALIVLCQFHETHYTAYKVVHEKGFTYENDKGNIVQRPEVAIMKNAAHELRLMDSEFGMTPASRSKVSALKADGGDDDPWQSL